MLSKNVKPLRENAKKVLAQLSDCIGEMQALIGQHALPLGDAVQTPA